MTETRRRSVLAPWLLATFAAVTVAAGCGASPTPKPAEPTNLQCGWREGMKTCASDADCPSDASCVDGLGKPIVHERKDGVEDMPPYDREHVKYCRPRQCPPEPSAPPPA